MADKTLVVKGGTLIDGTGKAPLEHAVIIIENGRFKEIGRAGQIKEPEGAEVIDARGLTILPGFIDGHAHLEDFHGELYLHLGITTVTTIQIFQDGPWTSAQKRGTELGKIRGPRIWMAGRAIGGTRVMTDAPDGRTDRGNIIVTTPDEARAAVRRKHSMGIDVIKLNEFLPLDLVKVVVDEAQDSNPIRIALAAKLLGPRGRLIAVGDNRQSIMGFAGALMTVPERVGSKHG